MLWGGCGRVCRLRSRCLKPSRRSGGYLFKLMSGPLLTATARQIRSNGASALDLVKKRINYLWTNRRCDTLLSDQAVAPD